MKKGKHNKNLLTQLNQVYTIFYYDGGFYEKFYKKTVPYIYHCQFYVLFAISCRICQAICFSRTQYMVFTNYPIVASIYDLIRFVDSNEFGYPLL